MVLPTESDLRKMKKAELKAWLTDNDQRLPNDEKLKDYYVKRAITYLKSIPSDEDDSDNDTNNQAPTKPTPLSKAIRRRRQSMTGNNSSGTKIKRTVRKSGSVKKSNANSVTSSGTRIVKTKRKTPLKSNTPKSGNAQKKSIPRRNVSNKESPSLSHSLKQKRQRMRNRRATYDPSTLANATNFNDDDDSNNGSPNQKYLINEAPESMTIQQLKQWLTKHDIEFPPIAQRKRYYVDLVSQYSIVKSLKRDLSPEYKQQNKYSPKPSKRPRKVSPNKYSNSKSNSNKKKYNNKSPPLPPNINLSPLTPGGSTGNSINRTNSRINNNNNNNNNIPYSPLNPYNPNNQDYDSDNYNQGHTSMLKTPVILRDGPKPVSDSLRDKMRQEISSLLDFDSDTEDIDNITKQNTIRNQQMSTMKSHNNNNNSNNSNNNNFSLTSPTTFFKSFVSKFSPQRPQSVNDNNTANQNHRLKPSSNNNLEDENNDDDDSKQAITNHNNYKETPNGNEHEKSSNSGGGFLSGVFSSANKSNKSNKNNHKIQFSENSARNSVRRKSKPNGNRKSKGNMDRMKTNKRPEGHISRAKNGHNIQPMVNIDASEEEDVEDDEDDDDAMSPLAINKNNNIHSKPPKHLLDKVNNINNGIQDNNNYDDRINLREDEDDIETEPEQSISPSPRRSPRGKGKGKDRGGRARGRGRGRGRGNGRTKTPPRGKTPPKKGGNKKRKPKPKPVIVDYIDITKNNGVKNISIDKSIGKNDTSKHSSSSFRGWILIGIFGLFLAAIGSILLDMQLVDMIGIVLGFTSSNYGNYYGYGFNKEFEWFCDVGKKSVNGQIFDKNDEACLSCPSEHIKYCENGRAYCEKHYILSGKHCVLNNEAVQIGHDIELKSSQILAKYNGRYDCGEDIEPGLTNNQLKAQVQTAMKNPPKFESGWEYFVANVVSDSMIIRYNNEKHRFYGEKSDKKWSCRVRHAFWRQIHYIFLLILILCMVIFIYYKRQSNVKYNKLMKSMYDYVMNLLTEQKQNSFEQPLHNIEHIPVSTIKQYVINKFIKQLGNSKTNQENAWKIIENKISSDSNVQKSMRMVDGVSKKCWKLSDVAMTSLKPNIRKVQPNNNNNNNNNLPQQINNTSKNINTIMESDTVYSVPVPSNERPNKHNILSNVAQDNTKVNTTNTNNNQKHSLYSPSRSFGVTPMIGKNQSILNKLSPSKWFGGDKQVNNGKENDSRMGNVNNSNSHVPHYSKYNPY